MTLDEALARYPGAQTFKFGDSQWMSDQLLALVREGRKTATCGDLRDYEAEPEAMPVVGRRDVALEWDGTPALAIETLDVTQARYCDVAEDFALAEGENDSLAQWREHHRRYFERHSGWHAEMMLVCERFRMIEDFASGGSISDTKKG